MQFSCNIKKLDGNTWVFPDFLLLQLMWVLLYKIIFSPVFLSLRIARNSRNRSNSCFSNCYTNVSSQIPLVCSEVVVPDCIWKLTTNKPTKEEKLSVSLKKSIWFFFRLVWVPIRKQQIVKKGVLNFCIQIFCLKSWALNVYNIIILILHVHGWTGKDWSYCKYYSRYTRV